MSRPSKHSAKKPQLDSGFANKEIDKVEKQFDETEKHLSTLSVDEMNKAPLVKDEPQTKMSKKEVKEYDAPVIRPSKSFTMPIPKAGMPSWAPEAIARDEELVKVIAENNEVIGEHIELWAGNYPGQVCGFYQVPVNIPIWIARKVAKRISQCKYHRMKMIDRSQSRLHAEMSSQGTSSNPSGELTVTETKQRLDCRLADAGFDFR